MAAYLLVILMALGALAYLPLEDDISGHQRKAQALNIAQALSIQHRAALRYCRDKSCYQGRIEQREIERYLDPAIANAPLFQEQLFCSFYDGKNVVTFLKRCADGLKGGVLAGEVGAQLIERAAGTRGVGLYGQGGVYGNSAVLINQVSGVPLYPGAPIMAERP